MIIFQEISSYRQQVITKKHKTLEPVVTTTISLKGSFFINVDFACEIWSKYLDDANKYNSNSPNIIPEKVLNSLKEILFKFFAVESCIKNNNLNNMKMFDIRNELNTIMNSFRAEYSANFILDMSDLKEIIYVKFYTKLTKKRKKSDSYRFRNIPEMVESFIRLVEDTLIDYNTY